LLGPKVAAEVFATTWDVYLTLGLLPEDDDDCNTADRRPATKYWANIRLARMLGGDGETVSEPETAQLARAAMDRQVEHIVQALSLIRQRMPEPPHTFVVAGSGEFLARSVVSTSGVRIISLQEQLGAHVSEAACAYAVAMLAGEPHARQIKPKVP
jgi:hypothetical protein